MISSPLNATVKFLVNHSLLLFFAPGHILCYARTCCLESTLLPADYFVLFALVLLLFVLFYYMYSCMKISERDYRCFTSLFR
mmetsp:Transcript_12655/g.16441  ORF Transcript_12655/g.16441 Transcript_12655/m.16441 type:complete len:82 (+) Transcript_12655:165-410(+)